MALSQASAAEDGELSSQSSLCPADFDGSFFPFQGLRDTREREQEHRIIYVNGHKPASYSGVEPLKYANNEIVTSKVRI